MAEGTLADILDRQYAREVVEQDALMAYGQSEEIFIVDDPVLQEMQALQGALAGIFQLYIASELCDYTSRKVASAPIWAT